MGKQGASKRQPEDRPFFYADDPAADLLTGGCARIYCVGICGTGMASLALFLAAQGHRVSGSDDHTNYYPFDSLRRRGIEVLPGFPRRFTEAGETDLVMYSAAYLPQEHPEIDSARRAGILVLSYPQAVSRLSGRFSNICIAGTHGKTTTAMMVYLGLQQLGISAAPLIGVPVESDYSNPELLVIEACEYREHFLSYHPEYALITSVDYDHVDWYRDRDHYRSSFQAFCERTEKQLVVSGDQTDLSLENFKQAIIYGTGDGCEYRVQSAATKDWKGVKRYRFLPWELEASFQVPGDHIACDALGALLAAAAYGSRRLGRELTTEEITAIFHGISSYRGAPRRSEIIGEASGILFMDDYAHHPREISAMIQGLRERYPERRIVLDFIPHTRSRTRWFFKDFVHALSGADLLLLQEIYPSQRELSREDSISSADLAVQIDGARFFPTYDSAFTFLIGSLQSGDLFITMGAGDNRSLGIDLFNTWKEKESQ